MGGMGSGAGRAGRGKALCTICRRKMHQHCEGKDVEQQAQQRGDTHVAQALQHALQHSGPLFAAAYDCQWLSEGMAAERAHMSMLPSVAACCSTSSLDSIVAPRFNLPFALAQTCLIIIRVINQSRALFPFFGAFQPGPRLARSMERVRESM